MRQLYAWYAYVANECTQRLVEEGMSTGLTNAHTAHRFSVLYHLFARKQCILRSALHYLMRFILPPHSLASSWDGSLAITSLQVGTTLTSFQVDTNNNDFKLFDGIWLCIACDIYIVKDKIFDREIMHQRS